MCRRRLSEFFFSVASWHFGGARCARRYNNVGDLIFAESSSLHRPHQPAEPLRSSGGHVKLTDVLELGRLCIRLRLGFVDQLFEGGGSAMVRGGRGLFLLLNLDHVHKKTKQSIADKLDTHTPWIILNFSWSATAVNWYNSDFTNVVSRAWTVSTVTWSSCVGSTRSPSSPNTTPR